MRHKAAGGNRVEIHAKGNRSDRIGVDAGLGRRRKWAGWLWSRTGHDHGVMPLWHLQRLAVVSVSRKWFWWMWNGWSAYLSVPAAGPLVAACQQDRRPRRSWREGMDRSVSRRK